MQNELEYSLNRFSDASSRLNDGIAVCKDELDKDGVIQRFEFTFELLWKTLKIFLEDKGIICRSPKDCLVEAFKFGIIKDEKVFLEMLDDRNKTSHLYSKEESESIFNHIVEYYADEIEKLVINISDYEHSNNKD